MNSRSQIYNEQKDSLETLAALSKRGNTPVANVC